MIRETNSKSQSQVFQIPDLTDLMFWDMSEYAEFRDDGSAIQEFDIIATPYDDMWVEGIVTEVWGDFIVIDDCYVVDMWQAECCELIARVDTIATLYRWAVKAENNDYN